MCMASFAEKLIKIADNTPKIRNITAQAKSSADGLAVAIKDVSSAEHNVEVSVASKNLLPYPYVNGYTSTSIISNGITFTDNGDGTITINGQNDGSGNSFFYFRLNTPLPIKKGAYIGSVPSGMQFMATANGQYIAFNNAKIFEEDTQINSMYLQVAKGNTTVFENVIAYPMLEKGSKTTTYTPYIDISNVGIKRYGKNLFDPSKVPVRFEPVRGITLSYLPEEDCFLFNGTADITTNLFTTNLNMLGNVGAKYTVSTRYISGTVTPGNGTSYPVAYFSKDVDTVNPVTNWINAALRNEDTIIGSGYNNHLVLDTNYIRSFWFYIHNGDTFDNYKVRVQLEENSTATDYEPFKQPVDVVNGTVKSLSPNMTLISDAVGTKISCTYFNNSNNDAFAKSSRLLLMLKMLRNYLLNIVSGEV